MHFHNRREAGQQLAQRLIHYREEKPIILALPRGGVVIGFEIAQVLEAPLDIIIARKIGAPSQPELGIGAIAPGGIRILNEYAIHVLDISEEQIEHITAQELKEMHRRLNLYRGNRPFPEIRDHTIILVDDGIATGVTAQAAIQSIRRQKPNRIILAVPVAPPETVAKLGPQVDEVFCIITPPSMRAISLWYDDFQQTTDEEVIALLDCSWGKKGNRKAGERVR